MLEQRCTVELLSHHRLRFSFGEMDVHRQLSFARNLRRAVQKFIRAPLDCRGSWTTCSQPVRIVKRIDEGLALVEPDARRLGLALTHALDLIAEIRNGAS